jgi:hypothetical protein
MEKFKKVKKRGLSSDDARAIRKQGHDDALEFALAIGMNSDYLNDSSAKKDVIDLSGDTHSIKSGNKKWQIFLYSLNRFENDSGFIALNGMGELLADCIKSFPEDYAEYQNNKAYAKEKCKIPMQELCIKLQDKKRVRAFFYKSIFNGGEVNFLTVKHNGQFHIFFNDDVIRCFGDNLTVHNSKARNSKQFDNQKVVFKYNNINIAELEMRNDSLVHYREVRFNMYKSKVMNLFFEKIIESIEYNKKVIVYGRAIKKFHKKYKLSVK